MQNQYGLIKTVVTYHAEQRLNERGIEIPQLMDLDALFIAEHQDEQTYKFTKTYTDKKDLVFIGRLTNDRKTLEPLLIIVTVFKEKKKRYH